MGFFEERLAKVKRRSEQKRVKAGLPAISARQVAVDKQRGRFSVTEVDDMGGLEEGPIISGTDAHWRWDRGRE